MKKADLLGIQVKMKIKRQRRQPLLPHGKKPTSQLMVKPDLPAQRPINAQPHHTAAELPHQSLPVKTKSQVYVPIKFPTNSLTNWDLNILTYALPKDSSLLPVPSSLLLTSCDDQSILLHYYN
jgi:hypothetical protein